ncbi:sucrose-phosphate synthase [Anoxybacter fermentans]|uniref:sucrose-phosphate synthase n=1 Tax=Anoxybacter fermentans TaxID=1323375 RepID=A0A3S9SX58_9FIRM|nr:glycosyltransferase [Anoxybacter fermentans]AZR72848.1 sucrose-phosphate synthase [Anoxybacter fermentans]
MRIAFLNPQGNFDPEDRYWTEHPDFGGQLVYVKEVAQAMARQGIKVDIFTRRIVDPDWPGFESHIDYYPGVENLRIIRISFGGEKFLRKEDLWPHIDEYVNGICKYYQEKNCKPDFITTHYGDGGLAGALLKEKLGVPFTFTAHSLGAQKLDKLGATPENIRELNDIYHFTNRIPAERICMSNSAVNIVSTRMERFKQYSHHVYRGAIDVEDDKRFAVIPPGVNTKIFYPDCAGKCEQNIEKKIKTSFHRDLNPERLDFPCIIASSRLDPKKNHIGLVRAYAGNQKLLEKANLCIIVRGMENPWQEYTRLEGVEGQVLAQIIRTIEKKGIRGNVCFINLESQKELAECYRYFAKKGGIFALTALYEPFGLAPLEAAACGLPVVVTRNGGPSESFSDGKQEFAVLINPESEKEIAEGLLRLIDNHKEWQKIRQAGLERIKNRYTWDKTASGYLEVIERLLENGEHVERKITGWEISLKRLSELYFGEGKINDSDEV